MRVKDFKSYAACWKCVDLNETDSENEIKTYGGGLARRRIKREETGLQSSLPPSQVSIAQKTKQQQQILVRKSIRERKDMRWAGRVGMQTWDLKPWRSVGQFSVFYFYFFLS